MEMDESKAREILGNIIGPDDSLYCLGQYICWNPYDSTVTLDSEFTEEELEAIAWWMLNKHKSKVGL